MLRYGLTGVIVCGLLCAVLVVPASAQTAATDAQNKLLAKRAAEADCYRKIAETVKGLRLTSETYVRDFVTESDVIESEVDTWVKGVRLGDPRWYEDGTCEVKGEVTVAKLITHLKEIHTRHYHGDRIKGTDFENITQYVKKDIIEVIGMGAPRPELPLDLPEGVVEMLGPPPADLPLTIPDIWKSVPPNQRLMATRAAELDAKRKLLERIKGLRLTSNTLVRDFITEYDEIQANASGIVVGAQPKGRPYYHTDELIVDVTMEVPVESVITTIKELHTRHYKGDRVTGTDIVNLRKTINRQAFEATGSGVPKLEYVQQAAASTGEVMPDWITQRITAMGNGTDPAIGTPQGKLKAARAAELDAKRKLAEQVMGLRIDSDTLVRDFVTEYDNISSQVDAVLIGAIIEDTNWNADMATVRVSLPASDVWRVVHSQWVIVRHR
ncbi:MAG TPA: hypothetical protein VM243_09550 [Phycisphaerae bacterium]|nr:hypothetical protein [Phycisphaerae bacterium]